MKKRLLLSLLFTGLASSLAYADCDTGCCDKVERGAKECFSLYAAAGGSFTRCADICVDTSSGSYWPDVPEGYDSDLGRTGFIEYGIGYEWCEWFSLMATGQYRDTMDYAHRQTGIPVDFSFTDSGCRIFELDANTFMFSAIFDVTNLCGCEDWWFGVQIGGGIGFTHFTVQNFHLELESETEVPFPDDPTFRIDVPRRVRDTMYSTSNNSFAAQAFIGIEYTACNWMNIGVGYRFFHGGDFCTNDYVDNSRAIDRSIDRPYSDYSHPVDPWQGRLQANEIYLNVYCSY